ncbi:MAG: EamA family transporter [Bacteroidales bacterium]|nr:EamA family transporter [Bacteroidales bacterium]
MIYLLSAIIFGSLFSVVLKLCQRWQIDSQQVILFNYASAFVITLVPILFRMAGPGGGPLQDFTLRPASVGACVLQGVLFLTGFSIMDLCTWRCGVALTTTAARASLVLPVLLSWIFLSQPAPSWLAVGLILAAMVLIVLPAGERNTAGSLQSSSAEARPAGAKTSGRRRAAMALVAVFLAFGLSDFTLKLAQHSVEPVSAGDATLLDRQLDALTCVIFLMASLAGLVVCLVTGSFRKHQVDWRSLLAGLALGLVNIVCTSCSLKALSVLSTGTFYPLYNMGIVILATLIGVLFFKEKLRPLQIAGLALSIVAIALAF